MTGECQGDPSDGRLVAKSVEWVKLSTKTFDDEKVKVIESLPEADTILIIFVKLLVLAGRVNDGGRIYIEPSLPYTTEMLAAVLGRPLSSVRLALSTLSRLGIVASDGDVLVLTNWWKHQNTDALERIRHNQALASRRHRERLRNASLGVQLLGTGGASPVDGQAAEETPASDEGHHMTKDMTRHMTSHDVSISSSPSGSKSLVKTHPEEKEPPLDDKPALNEDKGSEYRGGNGSCSVEVVEQVFLKVLGPLSEKEKESLRRAVGVGGDELVLSAMAETKARGKEGWRYVASVLRNWQEEGRHRTEKGVAVLRVIDPAYFKRGKHGHVVKQ